ncbi:hypothetical protein EMCG_09447 [[Emmonsia] crescens]|uniref:Extracellular membrane protein CFEM domain-containing protein n=1 Tax=[Emmonsia] crescens TaxID=73230 RepID=A0A0G2J326_9EURO|nr:hypothetical protein EMCG_09447 [Emmonsia crescens UAMH 3008]
MKFPLEVLAALLAAPIGIFAHPPGYWRKCSLEFRCLADYMCQQSLDCWELALNHDENYIKCGIGVWEPQRCWVYATYPSVGSGLNKTELTNTTATANSTLE